MQTTVPLYGFGGISYGAVRRVTQRNLLDNSDFTNLVAQAGIGGIHGIQSYAADRWILTSGTVSYEAGIGLTLIGTITQILERVPASATPAVGVESGDAVIRFEDSAVTITSGGCVLKWAALYEGTYTTATLPEYRAKGYAAEMLECMRYYQVHTPNTHLFKDSNEAYSCYIMFFVPMRIIPTISYTGTAQSVSYTTITGTRFNGFSGNYVSSFEALADL